MSEPTDSIYQRALDTFGEAAQIGQLHEEMGELMQAINKHSRSEQGTSTQVAHRHNVIEETVDLVIMCEQMRCIFDTNDRFKEMMEYKLWRLGETIDREDTKQFTDGQLGEMLGDMEGNTCATTE